MALSTSTWRSTKELACPFITTAMKYASPFAHTNGTMDPNKFRRMPLTECALRNAEVALMTRSSPEGDRLSKVSSALNSVSFVMLRAITAFY